MSQADAVNADPKRPSHAGQPILDDDATIARMLEDVSIPTLLLSMVHMTGSPWRLVDYWDWTREPDLDDFDLS